ncbi:MAG: hypothetical protein ACE5D1_08620, partial [Fidelibacterota bacterium]
SHTGSGIDVGDSKCFQNIHSMLHKVKLSFPPEKRSGSTDGRYAGFISGGSACESDHSYRQIRVQDSNNSREYYEFRRSFGMNGMLFRPVLIGKGLTTV